MRKRCGKLVSKNKTCACATDLATDCSTVFEAFPALPDGNASLGSAEVGAALSNPPTPGSGARGGSGNYRRETIALEAQEASSGQGGLGVSTCTNRAKPPSDFRGALSYNHYFCLRALQWFPLDSLIVPRGALSFPGSHSEVRSPTFSLPKSRFGSIIGPKNLISGVTELLVPAPT